MYTLVPKIVLGFHGCDKSVGEEILAGKKNIKHSNNDYDWLGKGSYFWESDPDRAYNFAESLKENPQKNKNQIETPFVLGAIIDLGHCLNLLNYKSLEILNENYQTLKKLFDILGKSMPENKSVPGEEDLLIRRLDRLVIKATHVFNEGRKYDTVRGVFFEGRDLYPNAGFKEKNHIQICVRNSNCIKGFFRVRQSDLSEIIP